MVEIDTEPICSESYMYARKRLFSLFPTGAFLWQSIFHNPTLIKRNLYKVKCVAPVVDSAWEPCSDGETAGVPLDDASLVLPAESLSEENVYRLAVEVATVDGRSSMDSVFVFPVRLPVLQVRVVRSAQ